MIMENVVSIIRFAVCYGLLCVLFPSLCLHSYVKDKDLTWRIVFYQAVANGYLIVVGYILSFIGAFYVWTLWLILVGLPIAWKLWVSKKQVGNWFVRIRNWISNVRGGFIGRKQRRRSFLLGAGRVWKYLYRNYINGRILQTVFWAGLIVVMMSVLGYFRLHNAGYGFTDEETHIYWISCVIHNKAFPTGLYPYGMHFLVAALTTMFGLPMARTYLCLSLFSMVMIFWTAYLFFTRIFKSRAAVILAMGIFLATDFFSVKTCYRYQISLPMELGMVALFVMFIGLLDYLRVKDKRSLWLFVIGMFWSFHLHFYVTIFAIFICLGFGVAYLIPMIRKKIFFKVILSGVIALVLCMAPFAVGYAAGFTFERSIAWGFDILKGGDGSSTLPGNNTDTEDDEDTDETSSVDVKKEWMIASSDGEMEIQYDDESEADSADSESDGADSGTVGMDGGQSAEEAGVDLSTTDENLTETVEEYHIWENPYIMSIINSDDVESFDYDLDIMVVHDVKSACRFLVRMTAYYMTSKMDYAEVFLGLGAFSLLFSVFGVLICLLRKGKNLERYLGYLVYSLTWLAGWFCYAMGMLQLPALIASLRAAVFLSVWSIGLFAMPVEIVFHMLQLIPGKKWQDILLYVGTLFVMVGIYRDGYVREVSDMYYAFAIQEADIRSVLKVMEEEEDFKWTFISATNDLSVLRYNGYHYEVLELLQEMEDGETEIYIPTPEIYVVVENTVPNFGYGENREVDGSDFKEKSYSIDPEMAKVTLEELGLDSLATIDRAYYQYRVQIMSKLYYWMEKIKEVYPSEVFTYYEDEYCTVYYIKQDSYFLLNLAVDYSDKIEEALEANE